MTSITPTSKSGLPAKLQTAPVKVQAPCGVTQVQWDNDQACTPIGQLVFFTQFLECSGLLENWLLEAPLFYKSNNAPQPRDILCTMMLSILAGHNRFCNMEQIYGDTVSAQVLKLKKIYSDDSTRRGIKRMDEKAALKWLEDNQRYCWEPMLTRSWILDIDSTVKPVFGRQQEGAAIGYNPVRPGRPSYSYHSYFIANTRISLGVEVRPGNEHAGSFALPRLFQFIDQLDASQLPYLIRGDVSYGSDAMMKACEERSLKYLFKLKMSAKVKELIQCSQGSDTLWEDAGQGWKGYKTKIRLSTWEEERTVVIQRRQRKVKASKNKKKNISDQEKEQFLFPEIMEESLQEWEYSVLVTNLNDSVKAIAQHYRDRGDCENNYDEYKNQWGWGGYVTKDLRTTRIMAAMVALVANWWNIYTRLAIPTKHAEAITSRPWLLEAVGRLILTGGQRLIRLSTNNSDAQKIVKVTQKIAKFLSSLTAEQLDPKLRWAAIIKRAFIFFELKEQAQMIPKIE